MKKIERESFCISHVADEFYTQSGYFIHIDLDSDENLSPHTQTVIHEYILFFRYIALLHNENFDED